MKKKYLIYLCGLVLIAAIIIGGIIAGANLSYKGESVSVKNSSSSSDSSETGNEEPTEEAKPVSYKGVVFAGDSILEDVYNYVPIKKAKYVVKSGMGTYTFYESDYFDAGKTSATGVEMVIKYKAQTVFMCFGMNESVFKDDKGIIEYYAYAVEDIREEKGPRKYTLTDCMRFGRIANILFVVFIIVCLIYYYSLASKGDFSIPFEVVAYSIEIIAFLLFSTSAIWMERLVRARKIMKFLLIIYILVDLSMIYSFMILI